MLVMPYRKLLFDHMKENARIKNIELDRINGYIDHVHCLVWLKPEQTIGGIAKLLKGESAYWFNNKSGFEHSRLQWQTNYFAVSVSLSGLDAVRAYIDTQETHHQQQTYEKECAEFMKEYLFEKDIDNSLLHYKRNTGH
jgi:REP element-mobilizing transposase RayT